MRRLGPRVPEVHVPLPVHILHAEALINRCLIRIRRRPRQVVVVEPPKKLPLLPQLLVDADRKLIRIRHYIGWRRVSPCPIRACGIIRQRIALQHRGDPRVHRNHQRIRAPVRILHQVLSCALGRGWHRQYLGRSQHLPEPLILTEVKRLPSVRDMWDHHRPAIREPKLVPLKRWNPPPLHHRGIVEVIPRIERRIPQKLKYRPVKSRLPRAGHDVCEPRRAPPNLRRHPPGTGLELLDRIDVEIRERAAAHLRIADVRAVHGEYRLHATLPIDRELLCEVGRPVCVGHRAGRQEQQRAEVAPVQRQGTHRLARQLLASARPRSAARGAIRLRGGRPRDRRARRRPGKRYQERRHRQCILICNRQCDRTARSHRRSLRRRASREPHHHLTRHRRNQCKVESPVRPRSRPLHDAQSGQLERSACNSYPSAAADDPTPRNATRVLPPRRPRPQRAQSQANNPNPQRPPTPVSHLHDRTPAASITF